jgi:diacylglycerol kinase
MSDMNSFQKETSWRAKFRFAGRGILAGFKGQNSVYVHLPAAIVVTALGVWLDVSRAEFCVLMLCIALVLCTELLNSSLELLAKAITREYDPDIGTALDIASGAVLMATAVSIIVGLVILLPPLLAKVAWPLSA